MPLVDEQLQPLLPLLSRILENRPSPATCWRWINRGVKVRGGGRVKLRALRIGGSQYATAEDVYRFIDAQNPPVADDVPADDSGDGPRDETTTRRLEAAGLL